MKRLIIKSLSIVSFLLFVSLVTNAQSVFEVRFSINFIPYRGALLLWNDGSAKMRVRYYSSGKMKMVEESMTERDISGTASLIGYNPVYPGTDISFPNYSPDNFFIIHNENGDTKIRIVDETLNVADVSCNEVSGYYEKQSFLSDFNWRL